MQLVDNILLNGNTKLFKGARHTYAQMAGRNVANPTAMLLSAANMLDHIK